VGLIGYACSYIPVEILSAAGVKPYRLLHGEIKLAQDGEKLVRVDACPLVKSNISYFLEHRDEFRCLVGATGCDMARRMFDVLGDQIDIPILVMNNPRTDKFTIFNDEVDWLIRELENIFQVKITPEAIGREIEKWEAARRHYRVLDEKRSARPSLISTTDLHKAVINYHKGDIDFPPFVPEKASENHRVYFLGSALPYEANPFLALFEERLRIVGDFNCGVSRFLNVKPEEPTLTGLKQAYYGQPPCIVKRPNRPFYEYIGRRLKELQCKGIIAWTLDYCDSFEFELKRIESRFDLPVLRIRSDLSRSNLGQLKTRIEAFAEML
jgi:benzoyl-CoA reductase/2-hydroxyglutaryl-CoA dehydratase subunit BcrC/BadD/HgdB